MYSPSYNQIENRAEVLEFMRANNFAVVVTATGGEPRASHLPVLVEERSEGWVIVAHMAKNNPQWEAFFDDEVLVVFHGAHAYVSPRWYEEKERVPTWNYAAVHAYGKVKAFHGAEKRSARPSPNWSRTMTRNGSRTSRSCRPPIWKACSAASWLLKSRSTGSRPAGNSRRTAAGARWNSSPPNSRSPPCPGSATSSRSCACTGSINSADRRPRRGAGRCDHGMVPGQGRTRSPAARKSSAHRRCGQRRQRRDRLGQPRLPVAQPADAQDFPQGAGAQRPGGARVPLALGSGVLGLGLAVPRVLQRRQVRRTPRAQGALRALLAGALGPNRIRLRRCVSPQAGRGDVSLSQRRRPRRRDQEGRADESVRVSVSRARCGGSRAHRPGPGARAHCRRGVFGKR